MKFKLAIFDFDGTLANTFPWVMDNMDQVADKFKIERVNRDEIDELRSFDLRKLMKRFDVPAWKLPLMAKHVIASLAEDIHTVSLFEGIDDLLIYLSDQGMKLAVVSSNSYDNVRYVLGPTNANLIDYYECGVSIFGKATKFRKILHKSGVEPGDAISIGDEIRDILAAKHAHIASGAVLWGFGSIDALKAHDPDAMFASVSEIAKIIE
jgi:phosphoglycolate phosphatase